MILMINKQTNNKCELFNIHLMKKFSINFYFIYSRNKKNRAIISGKKKEKTKMETKRARKKNLKVRKISTKKRRLRIVIGFIHSFGRSVGRTHLHHHHMFDEKRQHQQLGHNYSLTIIISVLIITINLISSSNWTIQMRYYVKCHIYKKK